jgi:hypothetical protein
MLFSFKDIVKHSKLKLGVGRKRRVKHRIQGRCSFKLHSLLSSDSISGLPALTLRAQEWQRKHVPILRMSPAFARFSGGNGPFRRALSRCAKGLSAKDDDCCEKGFVPVSRIPKLEDMVWLDSEMQSR